MSVNELLTDRHLHTTYSDGKNSLEEMVQAAIARGMQQIAITDHMPLPFSDECAIPKDRLLEYREAVLAAKKTYARQIDILLGIELDYLPQHLDWVQEIVALGWDWVMGSVHFLSIGDTVDQPYIVDYAENVFREVLEKGAQGDIRKLCADYYANVQALVQTGWIDCLSHIDLVKKNNRNNQFFNQNESWYQEMVREVLYVVKSFDVMVELNTAGLVKPCAEQYPSEWIIKQCLSRGIPLVLNSDAHCTEEIGREFERFLTLLDITSPASGERRSRDLTLINFSSPTVGEGRSRDLTLINFPSPASGEGTSTRGEHHESKKSTGNT
ncbi:MAG TPA: histidinol-phosphatase HisJ [bacterium]|nr:histidinol-phosphatase HisJ [bacterium]